MKAVVNIKVIIPLTSTNKYNAITFHLGIRTRVSERKSQDHALKKKSVRDKTKKEKVIYSKQKNCVKEKKTKITTIEKKSKR